MNTIFNRRKAQCKTKEEQEKLGAAFKEKLRELREKAPNDATLQAEIDKAVFWAGDIPEPEGGSPDDVALMRGWERVLGAREAAEEFGKALGGSDTEFNPRPDPSILLPFDIPYLSPRTEALGKISGLDAAQNQRTSSAAVRHPGWPAESFSCTSLNGAFSVDGRTYRILDILVDTRDRVVAVQLRKEGADPGTKLEEWRQAGYFNFVQSRRNGSNRYKAYVKTEGNADCVIVRSCLVDDGGKTLENVALYVPKPIAAMCRHVVSKVRKDSVATSTSGGGE